MKTLKSGAFASYAKVLNNEEIDRIKEITKDKINEVIDGIKMNNFDINPKVCENVNIGCGFCKFRDICFVKNDDMMEIKPKEFGGDCNGMD
jgi:ATP-dependent helicase/DNAse subunit B